MDFTHRPIETWPGPMTAHRVRSPFFASWGSTMKLLERELRFLGAKKVVLQEALLNQDIRLDRKPKANAKAAHPGVILSFDSKHGPLNYPCDRFDSWDDNVRAIALSLEHLRAVDRYGVTRSGEQYRGWARLPGPNGSAMTLGTALETLSRFANLAAADSKCSGPEICIWARGNGYPP